MDARDLLYPDNEFDAVIDKSTLDCILCGDEAYKNAGKMLMESQRVLKEGGYLFIVSYGKPEDREFHFEREHLSLQLRTFEHIKTAGKMTHASAGLDKPHYIYILKKNPGANEQAEDYWQMVV
jgi:ubiquinone/menaquinone biosynthesis C-methylase UbiE